MLSGRDKLHHALACAAITVAAFLALTLAVEGYRKVVGRRRDEVDGGDGGVDEEAGCERQSQSTDDEPSNRRNHSNGNRHSEGAGCQSSGGDILADFVGVVLGEVVICTMLWLSSAIRTRAMSSGPGAVSVDE
ncbi:hypothetical protein ACHAXT_010486 [Thalassiosira profunda]